MVSTQPPPPPTRSTITATTSNGTHELTVEGYSATKLLAPREHIATHKFGAAGHSWKICYYPNRGKETDATMSFSLKLADGWWKVAGTNVRAEVGFSLVPRQAAEPAPGAPPATVRFAARRRVVNFSLNKNVEHWGLTISKKELEKWPEYLRDDSLVLRCEIAVVDKPVVKMYHGLPVCRCKEDNCKLRHLKGASWLKDVVETYFLDCLGI
jgi:speckle-type POZ protein